jgi:carbon storage regulator
MLILARRPGERVVIGDEILVTVMEVSASTVRLGIEAPRGVSIFREEIWLAVKEENRAAAEASPDALPSQPVGETPVPPARETPTEPARETPTEPARETPTEPARETPTRPPGGTPAPPSEQTP